MFHDCRGRGHAVAFAASNDLLFVATSRNFVLCHDASGGPGTEIEITKNAESHIRRLFVDPLGVHVFVSLQTGSLVETFYIDSKWKTAQLLTKLKNIVITSIGWPSIYRANTLSEVLLGCDSGTLYSLTLQGTKKAKLKQVFSLPEIQSPIAGLAQLRLNTNTFHGGEPQVDHDSGKLHASTLIVLVLCGTRLYIFRGGSSLEELFMLYDPASLDAKNFKVFDLPIEQGAAQLQFLSTPISPEPGHLDGSIPFCMPKPSDFAVLSTSGIYYGKINLDLNLDDELDHLQAHKMLPISALQQQLKKSRGISATSEPIGLVDRPLSLVFTLHHLVLLYPSKLQFINRINKKIIQEIPLEHFASPLRGGIALPLGLSRDALAGRVVILAGDNALEIDNSNEDRDIWKVFMEKGDYRASLAFCRTSAQRNKVYLAEADSLLNEGYPVKAAAIYGRMTASDPSFEDIAIKIMNSNEPAALVAFLKARLDTLGKEDKLQSTMVASWLLELLLDCANRALLHRNEPAIEKVETESQRDGDANEAVKQFIKEYVDVLDPGTTKGLLEGYGRDEDLLEFAKARGDLEEAIECHIRRGEAERALEVLRMPEATASLMYRFAPSLIALAPAQTVQSWIDANTSLDPEQLLPALLPLAEPRTPPAARAEALRYVRYCFNQCGVANSSMHNFAVDLMVLDSEEEEHLLEYLSLARDALGKPLYDPSYALRLCKENNRQLAMVALFCEVELWEEGLKLAMLFDSKLAIDVISKVQKKGEENIARNLWLILAEHVINSNCSEDVCDPNEKVQSVKTLMEESRGLLRIEDVLQFLPDFLEIGALKPTICSSLEDHNKVVDNLKKEMNKISETMDELREGLEILECREAHVDLTLATCARCCRPLSQDPVASSGPYGGSLPRTFIFPTGNAFHGSCLCAEVVYLAPDTQGKRILALQARLAGIPLGTVEASSTAKEQMAEVTDLIKKLELEVANEDPYCGEIVARNISKPLISADDDIESWTI